MLFDFKSDKKRYFFTLELKLKRDFKIKKGFGTIPRIESELRTTWVTIMARLLA